jgi:putative hemolysin
MPPGTALTPAIIKIGVLNEQFNKLDALCSIWELGCYTGAGDSLLEDRGGIRTKLAKANIGFFALSIGVVEENLTHMSGMSKPMQATQQFAGQKPTWVYTPMSFYGTYNIPSKNMQFTVGVANVESNYQFMQGPNTLRMSMLNLHQTLLKGKFEYIVGYQQGDTTVADNYIGGSVGAGILGVKAVIPYNLGQSVSIYNTPALTLKYHFGRGIYATVMAARSTDPDTGIWGMKSRDIAGTRFAPKGDRVVYMPEIGYKVDAAPGHKMTFFRATGFYNTSHFLDYSTTTTFVQGFEAINYGLYGKLNKAAITPLFSTENPFAGVAPITANNHKLMSNGGFGLTIDRQLTQPDKFLSYRGVYLNAIGQYATPNANTYQQYYQVALYSLGLLKSRPLDMMVINGNRTQYSRTSLNTMQNLPNLACPYIVGASLYAEYLAGGTPTTTGAAGTRRCRPSPRSELRYINTDKRPSTTPRRSRERTRITSCTVCMPTPTGDIRDTRHLLLLLSSTAAQYRRSSQSLSDTSASFKNTSGV